MWFWKNNGPGPRFSPNEAALLAAKILGFFFVTRFVCGFVDAFASAVLDHINRR